MTLQSTLDKNLDALELKAYTPDDDPNVRVLPFDDNSWVAIRTLDSNEFQIFTSPLASMREVPKVGRPVMMMKMLKLSIESHIGVLKLDDDEDFRMVVNTNELDGQPSVFATGKLVSDVISEMQSFENELKKAIEELQSAASEPEDSDEDDTKGAGSGSGTVNRVRRFFEQN